MKLELKNIKVSESLSEETTAFTASLYINDKLVAGCKNQGHGGATSYYAHSEDDRKVIKEAEAYFAALPPTKSQYGDMPVTLESAIDDFLYAHLLELDKKKLDKRLQKDLLNGIVVRMEGQSNYSFYKFKIPIAEIQKDPRGVVFIKDTIKHIKSKLKKGESIINTNL